MRAILQIDGKRASGDQDGRWRGPQQGLRPSASSIRKCSSTSSLPKAGPLWRGAKAKQPCSTISVKEAPCRLVLAERPDHHANRWLPARDPPRPQAVLALGSPSGRLTRIGDFHQTTRSRFRQQPSDTGKMRLRRVFSPERRSAETQSPCYSPSFSLNPMPSDTEITLTSGRASLFPGLAATDSPNSPKKIAIA